MFLDRFFKRKKKDEAEAVGAEAVSTDAAQTEGGDAQAGGADTQTAAEDSAPAEADASMVRPDEAEWDERLDSEEGAQGDVLSVMPDELPDEPAATPEAAEEESELDKQLNQMLEADRKADEKFNPQANKALVQKASVYDGSLVDDESIPSDLQWENYKKKKEKAAPVKEMDTEKPKGLRQRIMRMSMPKLLACAFAVIAVFAGLGFGAILIAQNIVAAKAKEEDIARFTPITQPLSVTNDGNFIFVNQTIDFNGTRFSLSKISAGSVNTLVYFVQPPDLERYSFFMSDQNQNLYMRHAFAPASSTLAFDPLRTNVVFLTLTIHDNETGAEAAFLFRFTELPAFVPPKYFNSPTPVIQAEGGEEALPPLQVERVLISNTGTEIYYSVNNEDGGGISFGENADGQFMQLRQGNRYVRPFIGAPVETDYPNQAVTIGKMVFDPLPFTDQAVSLVLNGLNYSYSLTRRSVDIAALLDYQNNEPQELVTGKQRLFLEAMGMQSNHFILVLHGEDETGRRITTNVNATLTIDAEEDGVFNFEGECTSAANGTDVVFTLNGDEYMALAGTPVDRYKLTLNSVGYSIPQLEVPIDLAMAEESPDRWFGSAIPTLEGAFTQRLAYKSHLLALSEIEGFSPELMKDRTLMRYYQPAGMAEMPKYSAKLVSGAVLPGNIFTGVVEEEWMLGAGEDMTRSHRTHRVVAERDGTRWVITEDEVLNDD